jgi:hypothetical protein
MLILDFSKAQWGNDGFSKLKDWLTNQDRKNKYRFYHVDSKLYLCSDIFADNILILLNNWIKGLKMKMECLKIPPWALSPVMRSWTFMIDCTAVVVGSWLWKLMAGLAVKLIKNRLEDCSQGARAKSSPREFGNLSAQFHRSLLHENLGEQSFMIDEANWHWDSKVDMVIDYETLSRLVGWGGEWQTGLERVCKRTPKAGANELSSLPTPPAACKIPSLRTNINSTSTFGIILWSRHLWKWTTVLSRGPWEHNMGCWYRKAVQSPQMRLLGTEFTPGLHILLSHIGAVPAQMYDSANLQEMIECSVTSIVKGFPSIPVPGGPSMNGSMTP